MANYDVLVFLEYFADRANVVDGSGNRTPTRQWQNFYQEPQTLSIDSKATGTYGFLAFDAEGFGSSEGSEINDLTISAAATADLVDLTDAAMAADNLVIATLYIQNVGASSFDGGSAQQISRYIGTINSATTSDQSIEWTVNPAINKMEPQAPTRKITVDMLNKMRQRLR